MNDDDKTLVERLQAGGNGRNISNERRSADRIEALSRDLAESERIRSLAVEGLSVAADELLDMGDRAITAETDLAAAQAVIAVARIRMGPRLDDTHEDMLDDLYTILSTAPTAALDAALAQAKAGALEEAATAMASQWDHQFGGSPESWLRARAARYRAKGATT